jgi:hypothetical protein
VTTAERLLMARRRRQILDDETLDRLLLDMPVPEREDPWVKDFIGRLADIIRGVSGKK